MKKRIHILLIALVLGMPSVQGRVYQVVGSADGRLNAAGLPWEVAYRTTMNVNGMPNDLHVYSARFSEPVVDQLKDQFERQGADVKIVKTRDGARGLVRWENGEARILVLSPASQPNQMVFLFYPEPGKKTAPVRFPIPGYPGAMAQKTVTSDGSGSICSTMNTEDLPEQVLAYYAEMLSANGWRPVLPLDSSTERMAIYQKREQICTILASARPEGPNRVTLLVKGRGL